MLDYAVAQAHQLVLISSHLNLSMLSHVSPRHNFHVLPYQ